MIKLIIAMKRRADMSRQQFTDYQRSIHAPLLVLIPEAQRYIRKFTQNYPVPAPNYPDSPYDSIVEAWFDSVEDLNAFFTSENFLTKVDPDHVNFIDLSSIERMVCAERPVIE